MIKNRFEKELNSQVDDRNVNLQRWNIFWSQS